MKKLYNPKPRPIIIQYTNALHKGGVGSEQANKVRSKVEQFSEPEKHKTLRRFDSLDQIFLLKESILE